VEGDLDFMGTGVTRVTSGQLEVSLSLTGKRASKSQLGYVPLSACSRIRRFGPNGRCCRHA